MATLDDLIRNENQSECLTCYNDIAPRKGVKLQNCSHIICLSCLRQHVLSGLTIPVTCPECERKLDDRDIRGGLNVTELQQYEVMMLDYACGKIGMMDHCHQTDCCYRCELQKKVKTWDCPSCGSRNCYSCKAVHVGQSCRQYNAADHAHKDAKDIQMKIDTGKLRRCPECSSLLSKTGGCTFYRCTKCRTALCWNHNTGYRKENCRCSIYFIHSGDPLKEELLREEAKKSTKIMQERIQVATLSDLIRNENSFDCFTCCNSVSPRKGIKLRTCGHYTCLPCLKNHVLTGFKVPVGCPECEAHMDDRDVRGGLSIPELNRYENKMISYACRNSKKMNNCHQTDCSYRCELKKKVKTWDCPSCGSKNCYSCKAIHTDQNCREYKMAVQVQKDTQDIEMKISHGELRRCPQCRILIRKVAGSTFYRCTNCYTALCWDHNSRYREGNCKCPIYIIQPYDPLREELERKEEAEKHNSQHHKKTNRCLMS